MQYPDLEVTDVDNETIQKQTQSCSDEAVEHTEVRVKFLLSHWMRHFFLIFKSTAKTVLEVISFTSGELY